MTTEETDSCCCSAYRLLFGEEALEQFMSGKSLFGKDGAFAPMLKSLLKKLLKQKWILISTRKNVPVATSAMAKEKRR